MFPLSSLPCPDSVLLHRLTLRGNHYVIELTACRETVPCPGCARLSHRIHSHYRRTLADLPLQGKAVTLILHTRKFFCTNGDCSTRIFTERLFPLAPPYARRTVGLQHALTLIGLALGGCAGAVLARELQMVASRDTLLRTLRRHCLSAQTEQPRIVGIDDWAFRRGQRYGTILCDLERHRVIDLLADRSAQSAAQWFRDHPTVQIVSRDRGGIYAEAVRQGVPGAIQVADRWHLLKNLGEMLQRVIEREHKHLRQRVREQDVSKQGIGIGHEASLLIPHSRAPAAPTTSVDSPLSRAQEQSLSRRARRQTLLDNVMALHQQGIGTRAIARRTGLSRTTVRKYVKNKELPAWVCSKPRTRQIDPYRAYIEEQWEQGNRNGMHLWNEIRAQGFTGSIEAVYRLLKSWRIKSSVDGAIQRERALTIPSPRQMMWWLFYPEQAFRSVLHREGLDEAFQAKALGETCEQISHAIHIAAKRGRQFIEMMAKRQVDQFDDWLKAAENENVAELSQFVKGLRQDYDAVRAAFQLEWSNGQVEGQVNRLKMIKRQMYGKAGFELLRLRVLAAN